MNNKKKTELEESSVPKAEESGGILGKEKRLSSFEWVESLIIAIVVVGIVFTFVFRTVTVSGISMYPNLQNNDRLIVSSWFYRPSPGDVVVLRRTVGLNEPIVKRVIAVAGQKVDIDYDEGVVYIDGKPMDESDYLPPGVRTYQPVGGYERTEFPEGGLVVPEGYIFVLGDNRPKSEDSRYAAVGLVDERYVLGKAQFTLFPFDRFGVVKTGILKEMT